MKKCFLLLILLVIFSSCTGKKIQVATLQSPNLKSDSTSFYYENDTLLLKYNFYTNQGIVRFSIYNKLDIPIYIDWKKTAFIVGKNKMDYWVDEAVFNAQASTYTLYLNNRRYNYSSGSSYTSLQGTLSKEERITFIPPGTEIEKRSFVLMQNRQFNEMNKIPAEEVAASWKPTNTTKVKKLAFSADNSPLSFRNYITYSTKEDFSKEAYIDNFFWVNEVVEMHPQHHQGKRICITKEHRYMYAWPYEAPNAFYLLKMTR